MKLETILEAVLLCQYELDREFDDQNKFDKFLRQRDAFRARILRMDAEKDARIAELEAMKAWVERPFDDPTGRYEMTNEEWSDVP